MSHDRSAASKKGWVKHRAKYEASYKKIKEDRCASIAPKQCQGCEVLLTVKQIKYKCKFCSHSCSARHNNIINGRRRLVDKVCESCGEEFETSHHEQRFCNRECGVVSHRTTYIQRWLDGAEHGGKDGAVSTLVRRWLLEKHNHQCSVCAWKEVNQTSGKCPLNVDHIDGNSENNRPENLTILCPNCHSLTPTYGSLNRGNGRRFRHGVRKPEKLAT